MTDQQPAPPVQPPPPDLCTHCGGRLHNMVTERIRTGGTSGGWVALLGPLAQLDEGVLALGAWPCEQRRRVEFRVPVAA
jgi:hypothetical protein